MTDFAYMGAVTLAEAVRARDVSAGELLDYFIARTERLDPVVNAVVVRDFDRARARAAEADAALARGEIRGPLHGLPMTVKESFDVEGLPTTSGAPALADNVARTDAAAVARLKAAGAVIFGKTNLSLYTGDLQSYNEVYGTTRNPWNPDRVVGGSSGGSAAALAAGLTPLELGSDIGGSIRNPAHFCGVFGHKPSFRLVPERGHVPNEPGSLAVTDIAVMGPLARSAGDLERALDILAAPDQWVSPAWRVGLPAPRRERLGDYRVALWLDDPAAPIAASYGALLQKTADRLARAGARVVEARPDIDFAEAFDLYYELLAAAMSGGLPASTLDRFRDRLAAGGEDARAYRTRFMRGATLAHADWLAADARRQQLRRRWADFFTDFDVLLCPVTPTAAFPHDHHPDMYERTLTVDGAARPYMDIVQWAGVIGVVYLPATVAPIGLTDEGLPVGVQVVGPYMEDRTPIAFAGLLAEQTGGFTPPPGF